MELTGHLSALLAAEQVEELAGGHQARVFRALLPGGVVVAAKVLSAASVDRVTLDARLQVTAALADLDPRVCRPLPVGGGLVGELTLADGTMGYVVCSEFAEGRAPDPSVAADARGMGRALAQLHASMLRLPPANLPLVAALRSARRGVEASGPHQLLHGDFNAGNLRQTSDVVRIFDLDDCGYGPPAFDVANALYMVLFDATVQGAPDTAQTFRTSFVSGYRAEAPCVVDDDVLDHFIEERVRSLRHWLDHLDTAPIGIRDATPAWKATLRGFVATYRATSH